MIRNRFIFKSRDIILFIYLLNIILKVIFDVYYNEKKNLRIYSVVYYFFFNII